MTKKLIILSIVISAILTAFFFRDVQKTQFLYMQDEFLVLTKLENSVSFFTQNPVDLGSANTTILVVTFFDRLYYAIVNYFSLSVYYTQHILYFSKLLLLILVPFFGFRQLSEVFKSKNDELVIYIVSLWYSFNTYTLIYWHGNGFSLTLLICYALAPLAFAYYHRAVFEGKKLTDSMLFAILAFLMSFALYFFAVFSLLLVVYTLLYTITQKKQMLSIAKNFSKVILLFLPFTSILALILYDMVYSSAQTVNLTGGETYGNIQGGLLFQMLMWFTWAIYTHWEPRNIYTFYKYFLTIPSILAPFIVYGLIFYGTLKKKKDIFLIIFIFLFLLAMFFAKGAQSPLGGIYLYLIEHSSLFRIFRSPDNKFGFGIVFTITNLLLLTAQTYTKKLFIILLMAVILIQSYPFLSGVAIIGENTKTSSARILSIPNDYQEVALFLNSHTDPYGYIIPFPSAEVGHFTLDNGITHIGQDLLPKLTDAPFIYISDYSGMLRATHDKLARILKEAKLEDLNQFPIRYYIIRKDVKMKKLDSKLNKQIAGSFHLVFKNKRFEVYENTHAAPLIHSNNIQFEVVNPIKYTLTLKNLNKEQLISFNQNFNSNWKLYPENKDSISDCTHFVLFAQDIKQCMRSHDVIEPQDIRYAWRKSVLDQTHRLDKNYANAWVVSPEIIKNSWDTNYYKTNDDGSIDVRLTLYFKTQSIFYIGVLISGIYLLLLSSYLIMQQIKNRKLKKRKNNEK